MKQFMLYFIVIAYASSEGLDETARILHIRTV